MSALVRPAEPPAVAPTRGGRVRVTFLVGSLDLGGAERQLVRLANSLAPERFEARIVTMFAGGPLLAELRPGIPVTHLCLREAGRRKSRWPFVLGARLLLRLHRGLRAERPDVLHAYMPVAYVMGALAGWALRIPVVVAGRRGLTSFHVYPQWRWRLLARLANRRIDLHICNSEAVRRWAVEREGLSVDRTAVVPNGLDPPEGTAPELEPAWRGPASAAMIANLMHYKGHEHVLRAAALVARAHPEFRLVLFGDGPERDRVLGLRRELGLDARVVLAGRRPDAARFLPGFGFAVLGSLHEGFPNALMEAMAGGVPVVATAVGGVPELVEDGVHGLLVPPADPRAMAEAITWMIEHPEERRRMGRAGRERVLERFGVDRMVRRTEALYASALA